MADEAAWPKTCRCGASWSEATWQTLPFVGIAGGGGAEGTDGDDDELELRNCTCGSTLAVRKPASEL